MFDNNDHILYEDEQALDYLPVPRAPWQHFVRQDPFMNMNDWEFRINVEEGFCFESKLCFLPYLKEDRRGNVLTDHTPSNYFTDL